MPSPAKTPFFKRVPREACAFGSCVSHAYCKEDGMVFSYLASFLHGIGLSLGKNEGLSDAEVSCEYGP